MGVLPLYREAKSNECSNAKTSCVFAFSRSIRRLHLTNIAVFGDYATPHSPDALVKFVEILKNILNFSMKV